MVLSKRMTSRSCVTYSGSRPRVHSARTSERSLGVPVFSSKGTSHRPGPHEYRHTGVHTLPFGGPHRWQLSLTP